MANLDLGQPVPEDQLDTIDLEIFGEIWEVPRPSPGLMVTLGSDTRTLGAGTALLKLIRAVVPPEPLEKIESALVDPQYPTFLSDLGDWVREELIPKISDQPNPTVPSGSAPRRRAPGRSSTASSASTGSTPSPTRRRASSGSSGSGSTAS
jgi:hypothetical protein